MRWDIICQVSNWKSTFLLLSYKPVKTGYNGNAGIGCTTIIQQCITKSQVMEKKNPNTYVWRKCYRKCMSCNYKGEILPALLLGRKDSVCSRTAGFVLQWANTLLEVKNQGVEIMLVALVEIYPGWETCIWIMKDTLSHQIFTIQQLPLSENITLQKCVPITYSCRQSWWNIYAINKFGKWELSIMQDAKDSLPLSISGLLHV